MYCGHTTCGLTINENDSGLDTDMKAVLERIAPYSSKHYYAHDKERTPAERAVHGERDNGHSHARAMVATYPELTIPVTASKLHLGSGKRSCWPSSTDHGHESCWSAPVLKRVTQGRDLGTSRLRLGC